MVAVVWLGLLLLCGYRYLIISRGFLSWVEDNILVCDDRVADKREVAGGVLRGIRAVEVADLP